MKTVNYFSILKNAWKITWKNRYLWWFGFFVALSSSGGMNYLWSQDEEKKVSLSEQQVMDFFSNNLHWILPLAAFLFLLCILLFILGIIGRGALISSIEKKFKGQESNFKSGFSEGKKSFWKIFSINLFLSLFMFLVLIILASPIIILFANKNYIIGGFLTLLAILILIPLLILAFYLKTYAYLYSILGKLKFWPSLENAYNLFSKNILSSILMGLIFIPIGMILGFAILSIAIIMILIFLLICGIAYLIFGKIAAIVLGGIGFVIFLVFLLFIRSIYEVFAQSVWIFFFSEIAKPKILEVAVETETKEEPVSKPIPVIEVTNKK